MYKQVILVRKDLKLPIGKCSAQVAHASVEATLRSSPAVVAKWRSEGMMKVALKVQSKDELFKYVQEAKDAGLVTGVITDAGKTVVAPGTHTCAAIGPASEEDIDDITGELPLL